MNLGRGFSVPQEKPLIEQKGRVWIPSTPDKPVVQRPIHPQAGMHQIESGPEHWSNLLGLYTDLLGNGPSSNGVPQKFNTANSYVGRAQRLSEDFNRSNVSMEQNHNIIDVETYNSRVTQNLNSSGSLVEQRIHNATSVQNYNNRLTQSFYQTGIDVNSNPHTASGKFRPSYVHNNIGSVVTSSRKVTSFTELMSSSVHAPVTNGEPSRNIISFREKPSNPFPQRQVECNARTYISAGDNHRPDHILHSNYNSGDSRLQQLSNSASSVPCRTSYNLNLPPISEAGESSGAAGPFQFGPVTPDQQNWSRNYIIRENPLLDNETVNQEKDLPKDGILPQQPARVIQSTIGSTPVAISPSPNEKNNPDFVNSGGGIDLNKTPQAKPPKRKKYTPKVVREKKPKKTPNPAVKKNNTPEGTPPTGKRKYVRRKGANTSTPPSTDAAANDIRVCNVESSEKSCRRQLNFDLEKGVEKGTQGREFIFQAQDNGMYKERNTVPFNLNLESCEAEWSAKMDGNSGFSQKDVHQNIKHNSYQEPEPQATKNQTLNAIAARILNARGENRLDQMHQNRSGGLAHIVTQENTSRLNSAGKRQHNVLNTSKTQGAKRDHSHAELAHSQSGSVMGSQLWSRGVSEVDQYLYHNNINIQQYPESIKKSRIDDKYPGTSSRMNSGVTAVQDCSGPIESSRTKGLLCQNGSGKEMCISTHSDKATHDWYLNYRNHWHKFQQQNTSSQEHQGEKIGQSTSNILTGAHSMNSCTTVTHYHQESAAPKQGPLVTRGNDVLYSESQVPMKGKIARKTPPKNSQGSSSQVKVVPRKKKMLFSVGDIIDSMKELNIDSNSGKVTVRREENALVPYRGGEGTIVVVDPIKRRKPRPKVNLDSETNRLWNLLMGKEGGESTSNVDANKEKWWEEERKVFRGRIDSFIARMHLVQGDRRFSKWKGSVVDSVIGVFLTQNVSDHLSSSAFMCLAAKFPLKATSTRQSFCQNGGTSSSSEKYKVHISFPDGTTSDDSSEINAVKERTTHIINDPVQKEDDLFSSQGSSESIVFQASEDLRSSSGSNSEAEDQLIGLNLNRSYLEVGGNSFPDKNPLISHPIGLACGSNMHSYPSTSNMPPIPPSSGSWLDMSIGLEAWNSDFPAISGKESISSLPNMDFGFTGNSPARSDLRNGQNFINFGLGGIHEVLQQEKAFQADPKRSTHASSSKQPNGKGPCIDNQVAIDGNATIEPDKIGKVHFSSREPSSSKEGNTSPNGRKRKADKEKVEPFNWDSLREEVLLKCGKTSVTPLDSLDYEALRNADVRVISETIKERGMNNMLAERMKDFLNRIVQDHGKIDLEWLRDVQPDIVKDYLLSIRGLGLKSVECLRLLTLHHSAFPVDTNVGRIAVRLGWVPLQPLPESLQLHLLEMYPMLESIQKYLWPRLCKLDQETLYELHYQMITFGKVFCTKREPNCNACPMRGECRHFASAFASARLALPGPEEKRVVQSSVAAGRTSARDIRPPEVMIKPVQGTSTRNCEPIIEEPSTPEAHIEELERDIEDAFYEDPDEIPVIKLNIDEFTTNLQSFMQENMEMQEVDMSKALVALSPALASLPTPKLKNVNRLRTEHQVYELPDFHPLLEGLDRREADDPSPYLLAIWTPGETADSIKPPERNCSNLEGGGGLCNVKTCFSCNTTRESQAQTVRGTILLPCRTAMRGSFPLNGTYFQVNELFADHESSLNPIDVPRRLLWNLPRRTVFFGTSASSIFKGLSTEEIQFCFWKGFVCVRGFDRETRAPRPLKARLHLAASKMEKPTDQKRRNPAAKKV